MAIASIHQPNFLPWVGYFHKILKSDYFVFFDDVQFPRGKSYGYRTAIKTKQGSGWCSIAIGNKSERNSYLQTTLAHTDWRRKVVNQLKENYRSAPYFGELFPWLEDLFSDDESVVSRYNSKLIISICEYMGIETSFYFSSNLSCDNFSGLEKILCIVKQLKADHYLSGQGSGSKRYIDQELFNEEGINLIWHKFQSAPYPQQFGEFIPNLSIIDLIMNAGPNSKAILEQG